MSCSCAESKINGVETGLCAHDCNYIALRNSCLEAAISFADRHASRNTNAWTLVFFRSMDRLMSRKNSKPDIVDAALGLRE
jgi:hypothetical protein